MPKDKLTNIANAVVVIVGPTASGKSGLAMELAVKYDGTIINADAMQIYRGVPVITAAPTPEDRQQVEHLLYEYLEPEQSGSVADWLPKAVDAVKMTWQKGKLPIVVGGTGFYIESLIRGLSPIPETREDAKKYVAEIFVSGGVDAAYRKLREVDAAGAALVRPKDTTRVRRALEIFTDTGKSIAEWFEKPLKRLLPEAEFCVVPLLPPLSELDVRCAKRFDMMMQKGALQEVKNLLQRGLDENLPVMKAIGVPELGCYLQGGCSLDDAVAAAKLHTRQYAKRQLTWFRNRLKTLPAEVADKDEF